MPQKLLARHVRLATPTGKRRRGLPRNRWRCTSPNLLGPAVVWNQQNYLRLLKAVRYFSSLGWCSRDQHQKMSMKMN